MAAPSRIRTWRAASTAPRHKVPDAASAPHTEHLQEPPGSCLSDAQLSPDGTCIFTSDHSRRFSVYAFPSHLSEETQHHLAPYAQLASADPIWAFAVNPHFDLNAPESTLVLLSRRDQYIGLHNALWDLSTNAEPERQCPPTGGPVDISSKLSSYKLVDRLTEAVLAPMSLEWLAQGSYFCAGQKNKVALFDLSHTEDPVVTIPTIPSNRNKLKGGGWGFKGDVSALSSCPPTSTVSADVLAAGTRTRYVGLYDMSSSQEITHLALPGAVHGGRTNDPNMQPATGEGVTQLKWSPDGQHLYVAERSSDALLIYDVRNFSLALGYCAGRRALTRQKMGFDVWSQMEDCHTRKNHEIWAGGTDGKLRVWRDPCLREGAIEADETFDVGEDPVSKVLVHSHGHAAVVASGKFEVGRTTESKGIKRGGLRGPMYSEWGCLDVLGLASC